MIRQRFALPKYRWCVYAYYVVTRPNADEILGALAHIGCAGEDLARAHENLMSGKCDTGLTYSNNTTHESVVVVAKTSSALEFAQSWTHELGHLACHVAQSYGIDLDGEEVRYINDALVKATWNKAKQLLCEHCRCH